MKSHCTPDLTAPTGPGPVFYRSRAGSLLSFLHCLPEFSQSFLFKAGYIGTTDATGRRDLSLGARPLAVQTVTQGNHFGFPLCQAVFNAASNFGTGIPGIQVLQHIVLHTDNIHQ